MPREDDNDQFGGWLAQQAALPPQPQQVGDQFVRAVFKAVAEVLPTADRDNTLEGTLELLIGECTERLTAAGVEAPRAQQFCDRVVQQAATGMALPVEELRGELRKALDTLRTDTQPELPLEWPPAREVLKFNDDQQLVTGWASVLDAVDGTELEDLQGDRLSEEDLQEAAHEFIKTRAAGEMHRRVHGVQGATVGEIVESLVVTTALKKALGLPDSVPRGWLVTVKVHDPDTWQKVRSGEYRMFSIGGTAHREPLAKQAEGTLFERLRAI